MSDSPRDDETPLDDESLELDPISESLTGTVVRGAGLAGAGFALSQTLTLGFYVALARLIDPNEFGQFAAAGVIVNVGLLFTESGMLAALIHRRDRLDEAAATAVIATAAGGVVFTLFALAASPLVGDFFDSARVGVLAAALSGVLFIRSLQVVPEALLQRRFSFLRRMVIEPVQVIAFGVTAVIASVKGLGAWSLVIGYYASAVFDAMLSWALVRWRPQFRLASFAMWRELVGYGRHVIASSIVIRIGDEIPTVLVGRFVGKGALGQYRYANRIASTPLGLILAAASYVVFPAFARISDNRERFTAAFLQSLRWFGVLMMPLSLILVPLGIPLAVVAFGDVWRDAGTAAMALSGYAVGASLVSIVSEAAKAEGRPDILVWVHLVSFGAATVAMIALLPFGLVGVSAGLSVGLLVGAGYALARISRILGIRAGSIVHELWPPAVSATLMAAVMLPVDRLLVDPTAHGTVVSLLLLAVEGLVALALYTGALVVTAPESVSRLRSLATSALRREGPASSMRSRTPSGERVP